MRGLKCLLVGAVVWVLAARDFGHVGQAQADCTVTVEPGQSIQEAIDGASEGVVICLSAGTWEENLVIEKSLTLQGREAGATLLKGTVTIKNAARVMISDMHIVRGSPGVDINQQAQVQLNRVRLTDNTSGVEVGESSRVSVTESELSNNEYGLFLGGQARASIRDSRIIRNLFGGIYGNSVELTITQSMISESGPQAEGLKVWGSSRVIIEDSEFSTNGLQALVAGDTSEVMIRNTRFIDNGSRYEPPSWFTEDGLSIDGAAHVVLEQVQVTGSGQSGLEISGQARVEIRNSQITHNQWDGLVLEDEAELQLEAVTVANNQSDGISVEDSARITLIRSWVADNGYNGLGVGSDAPALLIESVFENHPRCGVEVGPYQHFVFGWGNRFANNQQEYLCDIDYARLSRQLPSQPHSLSLVRVPEDVPSIQTAIDLVGDGGVIEVGPGVYEETLEILDLAITLRAAEAQLKPSEDIASPAITIFSSSPREVTLSGWTVSQGGLLIGGQAAVDLLGSHISHSEFSITHMARAEIRDSVIEGSSHPYRGGLTVGGSARIIVTDSQILRNSNGVWLCSAVVSCSAAVTLLNVTIKGNWQEGLRAQGQGVVLDVRQSTITGNGGNGLQLEGGVQLTLIESMVADNGGDGIYVFGRGPQLNLIANRIYNNVGCGIRVFVGVEGQFIGGQNEVRNNGRRDLCTEELDFKPSSTPSLDFLVVPVLRPSVVEVCPQGCAFASIAEAVAAVDRGGEVRVRAGSYTGRVVIGKSLTLVGEGPDDVILNGPIFVVREEPIQVTIDGITVRAVQGNGLLLGGQGQIQLRQLKILDNTGAGISVEGSAQVHLDEVVISGSWADGLVASGQATVEVRHSTIEGNGFPKAFIDWSCYDVIVTCNGISVAEGAQLVIADSIIRGNMDWGLAAVLQQCGYGSDDFTGQVFFEGTNIIEGNNTSGNLNGLGNPGNHPFTDLPDGNVCLPESSQTSTQAAIYRAQTPEPITRATAESLARQLLGLEAPALELQGLGKAGPWYLLALARPVVLPPVRRAFFVQSASARLLLTSQGLLVFYDVARLARAGEAEAKIASTQDDAYAQAEAFLTEHGLQLPSPGRLRLYEASAQTAELTPQLQELGASHPPRYWRLRYVYELPTSEQEARWLPVELVGPQPQAIYPEEAVGSLELWLGADGEIILLSWLWWEKVEATHTLLVRSHEEALALAYKQLGALVPELVGNLSLSVPDEPKLELRYLAGEVPFQFDLLAELGPRLGRAEDGLWIHPVYVHPFTPIPALWLPATEFAPLVEIAMPEGRRQERDLYFVYWEVPAEKPVLTRAVVRGGTSPYLYSWWLWLAQEEPGFSVPRREPRWQGGTEPEVIWDLEPGWYHLLVTVRDAHGLSHTQAINLHVEQREQGEDGP